MASRALPRTGAVAGSGNTAASGQAWHRAGQAVLSLLLLFLLWEVAARIAGNPRLMPGPLAVLTTLGRELVAGELLLHLGMTLWRVAASFTLAMTLGMVLGILLGRSRACDAIGGPWVIFFLNLPALVVIVLAYVWIGLTETAAVTAVAINKIPNVTVTIREGVRAIDSDLMAMARIFRIGRGRTLRHVILPQLAPYVLAASRTGLALVWKIVLVVELLGRSNGVGFEIGTRFQLFDVTGILAYALAFVAIVQTIEWLVLQPLERRANAWRR